MHKLLTVGMLSLILAGCPRLPPPSPPPPAVIAESASAAPVAVPYGVASADQLRLFVSNPAWHIDAVETLTGRTLWTSPEPAKPLVALDEGLLALVGRQVVLYGPAGQRIWWSDALPEHPPLPPGANGANPTDLGWSTLEDARVEHGRLHVVLLVVSAGGGMVAPHEDKVGDAEIDLRSGRVTATFGPGLPRYESTGSLRNLMARNAPSLSTPRGAVELHVEAAAARPSSGPSGSLWMPQYLVATEGADHRVLWKHSVPGVDVTPWQ